MGLWLNLPRAQSRAALACAIGYSVANSNKPVSASLFDGVADSPEEAQELAFRVNAARNEARMKQAASKGLLGILGGK